MRRVSHSITRPGRFAQAAIKQLRHILKYKLAYVTAEKHGRVYFYPEMPHPYTAAYKALHLSGVQMVSGLPQITDQSPVVFIWEDSTINQCAVPAVSENWFVVNRGCKDISKSRVGKIHLEVFGYQAEVNPLVHVGPMVAKSDENGAHSGQVVTGPLEVIKPGWVYQQVINNSSDSLGLPSSGSGKAVDFRVPIFGSARQHAYIKYRPLSSRFGNVNDLAEFVDIDSLFTPREIENLNEFCKRAGLDYGEIDVIRDSASNLIFVLDVNKTPLGPPNGLSESGVADALSFYMQSFLQLVSRSNTL